MKEFVTVVVTVLKMYCSQKNELAKIILAV